MILQTSPAFSQWVQILANVALVLLTGVLAWATWQYAKQSKAQTREMEKSRGAEYKPVLKAGITSNFVGSHYWFEISNIGKGAAHDVVGQWYVECNKSDKKAWNIPIFHPEETYQFELPIDYSRVDKSEFSGTFKEGTESSIGLALEGGDASLIVSLSFKDAIGNKHEPEDQVIPIMQGMEGRMNAGEFKTEEA